MPVRPRAPLAKGSADGVVAERVADEAVDRVALSFLTFLAACFGWTRSVRELAPFGLQGLGPGGHVVGDQLVDAPVERLHLPLECRGREHAAWQPVREGERGQVVNARIHEAGRILLAHPAVTLVC